MRATEVSGPGRAVRDGNAIVAHCGDIINIGYQCALVEKTHSLLDIVHRLTGGEERELIARESLRRGNDLGAVDHRVRVLAELRDSEEDELEVGRELGLVVCASHSSGPHCVWKISMILTDEGLPFASSAIVTGDGGVGLQAHLTGQRRLDLTLVAAGSVRRMRKI